MTPQYFLVLLCQNIEILLPGVVICRKFPYCLRIYFEEIISCFVVNVIMWFICIINWFKFGCYQLNTNSWGHCWSKSVTNAPLQCQIPHFYQKCPKYRCFANIFQIQTIWRSHIIMFESKYNRISSKYNPKTIGSIPVHHI